MYSIGLGLKNGPMSNSVRVTADTPRTKCAMHEQFDARPHSIASG